MNETEMKTCPFCGRVPAMEEIRRWAVIRVSCDNEDCKVRPAAIGQTRKEAVDTWNTRLGQ